MAEYKSEYTGEEIDDGIAKANTAVQPEDLANVATSGSYNDLSNKPSEVTETTVANWGFTKNTGTYSKPSGGIPKTDLAEAVQTSLGKADTAIQDISSKQDTLVSGTNIKTINNTSILGSGNITIEGGSSDITVKEIDYSNSEEWVDNQPTQATILDILDNKYTLIHVYNVPIDEGIDAEMWLISNTMISVENSSNDNVRYYYKFDEGDVSDGTNPNIEQYMFYKPDGEDAIMKVDNFNLGTFIDSSHKLDADLVDDTSTTNKFVTASDKTTWSGKQDALVSGTNIKTINNTSLLGSGNISITTDEGLKEVYVNASTGSDSNAGTSWSAAKKTFASALAVASDDCTLFFEGDTQERLNIKTNANQKVLRIVGRDGVRNRILGGTKLVDFQTTSTTGVYKIETPNTSAFSSNYYSIVQDNVIDTSTAISSYEAHPAQKGREYRLLSTPIPRKTSVANVISSTVGFYHDGTNLYVKPASTDFTNHPIYCPTENGGIYGNDGSCLVEISNVEVWHSPLLITNCPNAKLTDCTCCFALGTGGIKYDDSVNVILKRCEAAYVLNTSGYGDGINAHSSKYEALSGNTNDSKIKYVSAELIDCWCHDCSDDGWSDHSACEVVIRGGLYEYNHKGGVTPSSGGKCTCYDVMTRKNCRGFYYVSSSTYQKEKTAYFYCENCISDGEDATRVSQGITRLAGAGFSTDDVGVTVSGWQGIKAKFVNCKSMNNAIGFGAGKKSTINLIDCSTLNVTNITSLLDDGSITKYVTEPVSSAIAVTGVSINKTTQTADYNQTFTLTANIAPSNATNQNVTWSIISGSEYISINSSGLSCSVTTGSSNGSAVVRVTTEDGSYTAQCAITIEHKELVSLTTTGTLSKTSYFEGETLDTTGLTFTATFDDSSSTVLNANELSYNPDPLTIGTTSVDVSYTYGSVTKTVTVSGITVYAPLSVTWEQGAIQADIGNSNAANRIRTQGFIDLQETGSFSIKTLQGAKGCWWSYTSDATTQTRSTSSANAWVDYSEGFVISQSVVGARYVRFAIKKQDDANIVPSEADTYFEFIR